MRRNLFHETGLALLLVVAGVAQAADKNKVDMASDQDYTALGQLKEITGKVVKVNATDKSFTVRLDMAQANPKGLNNLVRADNRAAEDQDRILREEQDALRTLNPIQRAQKMQRLAAELQREQARLASRQANATTTVHKDFELESTPDAKVRRQDPPVQYDEKGNVKKYTAEELKELKGPDTKLPGYTADWTDLKDGQTIKITLSVPKKDKDNKDKDKTDTRPHASQVLIVKEPPDNADQGKKK
jgi:hypothetical protein